MSEARVQEFEVYDDATAEHAPLEIVDTQPPRPPKLTEEQAAFLLDQGPYVARLRASRKLFSAARAFAEDEQTASFMQDGHLAELAADVKQYQSELRAFNRAASKPKTQPEAEPIPTIEPETMIHPRLSVVPVIGEHAVASTARRDVEGRDSVNLYLEEISRTPLLTAELEVELSKAIEAALLARSILSGNSENTLDATEDELLWLAEQGDQAYSRFIEANLRLVVSIARKYGRTQMPMLDLVQEGNTGLIRAVEKFDYTKGYKFSTYATWWVKQAITRGISSF